MTTETGEAARRLTTRCCIAGGGPAGMMLGLLLARAGIDVVVLEKHGDFLRDFRGDTIHPSTLELMYELGMLDAFLKRPHQEAVRVGGEIGGRYIAFADMSHLPTHCKFLALMPQWDFLNFIAEQGARLPSFHLLMKADATGLVEEGGAVVGVRATTPDGPVEIPRADLTVAADGRHSTLRPLAGFTPRTLGAPMDVLWMRLPRRPTDTDQVLGRFDAGSIIILLNRDTYWQCAFVIPKGADADFRRGDIADFRRRVAMAAPILADRVEALKTWDDVKLLTVAVERLERWHRPGFLCIGDAAHAMSPIGGVGINLAIQDAVATANLLAEPLRRGRVTDDDLATVQRRRMFPTRVTQALQLFIQNKVVSPALRTDKPFKPPWAANLFNVIPWLRRIPARLVGMGVRPEHVRTPAAPAPRVNAEA